MRTIIMALAATALVGCGGGSGPELGEVQGVVTNNNGPVSGAEVRFFPEEGRPSVGTTDEQGHYTLGYSADYSGAKVGTHEVRVTIIGEAPPASPNATEKPVPPTQMFVMPAPVTVNAGENTVDIDLSKARPR